jgi:hypothetical protein
MVRLDTLDRLNICTITKGLISHTSLHTWRTTSLPASAFALIFPSFWSTLPLHYVIGARRFKTAYLSLFHGSNVQPYPVTCCYTTEGGSLQLNRCGSLICRKGLCHCYLLYLYNTSLKLSCMFWPVLYFKWMPIVGTYSCYAEATERNPINVPTACIQYATLKPTNAQYYSQAFHYIITLNTYMFRSPRDNHLGIKSKQHLTKPTTLA